MLEVRFTTSSIILTIFETIINLYSTQFNIHHHWIRTVPHQKIFQCNYFLNIKKFWSRENQNKLDSDVETLDQDEARYEALIYDSIHNKKL